MLIAISRENTKNITFSSQKKGNENSTLESEYLTQKMAEMEK